LKRDNNFDVVRIMAAAAVIYGHAHPLTATPDLVFLGNTIQSFAVKVFFIISGFLVARSWTNDPHPVRYIARRGLRIFPGLLLLLAITVLMIGPAMTDAGIRTYFSSSGTWIYVLYNAAMYPVYSLPDVFQDNVYPDAVNGSLWSLPVEFLMYLIFPVVYAFGRIEKSNRMLVGFALALCALSLYLIRVSPLNAPVVIYGTGLNSVLDTAPYFFLGAIFSVTRMREWLDPAIAVFLIGVVIFVLPQGPLFTELALYLVAPYAVLSFATASSPGLSRAGYFGDPSYGIYLYGWPMQQIACHFVPNLTPIGNTLIALPLAVIAAYCSWHIIEKRALAMKPWRHKDVNQLKTIVK